MSGRLFSPVVERALRVAARCHRHHRRKASDLPYLTHPAGVALILLRAGFGDEEILAAALLHDVVEDTDYSLEQMEAEFPAGVAEYVAVLTERKRDSDGTKRSWQDRKREHIEQIGEASVGAKAVVLADKLHNLGTMLYDLEAGDDLWSRFGASPDQVLWYHREMIERATVEDERLQRLAAECRELLERLEETL